MAGRESDQVAGPAGRSSTRPRRHRRPGRRWIRGPRPVLAAGENQPKIFCLARLRHL